MQHTEPQQFPLDSRFRFGALVHRTGVVFCGLCGSASDRLTPMAFVAVREWTGVHTPLGAAWMILLDVSAAWGQWVSAARRLVSRKCEGKLFSGQSQRVAPGILRLRRSSMLEDSFAALPNFTDSRGSGETQQYLQRSDSAR